MSSKVAIVTGASRGIGAATALLLADNGFDVCVNYLNNREKAESVASQIEAKGRKSVAIKADMGSEQEIIHMFRKVDEKLGSVAALVNNAGINGGFGLVEEITTEKLQEVFAANVFGVFICCREAIARMKKSGGGVIVSISSQAATFGGNRLAHYSASKGAINSMTIGLAREVFDYGIRVNAVSPGIIDTDMNKDMPREKIASLPGGKMAKPEAVAKLIVSIINDDNYSSGTIKPVAEAR